MGMTASAPEDVDAFLAGGEGDDGPLLTRRRVVRTGVAVARALRLAVDRVDLGDAPREQLLDRGADLDLVGVRCDDERVHVEVVARVRLLRHDRLDDDVARVLVHSSPPSPPSPSPASSLPSSSDVPPDRRATTVSSDASEKTSQSFTSTSYVLSSSGSTICTRSPRLRSDFHAASSSRNSTRRTRESRSPFVRSPTASSRRTASLVFGASIAQSSITTIFSPAARSDSAERNASRTIFFGVRCE